MKNKYYGQQKIKDFEITGERVILDLDNDTQVELSGKMAEVAVTEKKLDLTELREARLNPVAKAILKLYLDWDIKISEIEYVSTLAATSLNENIKEATEKLWGVGIEDKTTQDVDKVLKDGIK